MTEGSNILGIDVGVNGGFALWTDRLQVWKMPQSDKAIGILMGNIIDTFNPIVYLEKQQLQARDLVGGRGFHSSKMLMQFGYLRGILGYFEAHWCEVAPITWQSRLSLNKAKFDDKGKRKDFYKQRASELYDTKATLWSADAILIMHYGRVMQSSTQRRDVKWLEEHINIPDNLKLF